MSSPGGSSNTDDPPPPFNHRTTSSILHHAATTSYSLLPTTLFLTLLLFSFHTLVENGAVFLTSFIDHDPSLKSLLSRLDISPGPTTSTSSSSSPQSLPPFSRPRPRPFLHLTRVGTLDDDFFDDLNSLFGPPHSIPPNSTHISLSHLSHPSFQSGVSFKLVDNDNSQIHQNDSSIVIRNDVNEAVDLKIVISGVELGRKEAAMLFLLMSIITGAYGWVIIGFVVTYSWALGIVFVSVVNDLLGSYNSFLGIVSSGSSLGFKRLSGFISMRWAVRDALTQILGLWFFGEIHDQFSFFKLFLRLKLMPFSIASPWVPGYDREISGFLLVWFLVDTVVSFVFAVDSWVTIVSSRRGGREIVKEGCYLLGTMIHQSIQLKCLELILCGAFMRLVFGRVFGRPIAVLLQSFLAVYFMVAWLIFFFAARCKDATLSGRRFGRRELESLVGGIR